LSQQRDPFRGFVPQHLSFSTAAACEGRVGTADHEASTSARYSSPHCVVNSVSEDEELAGFPECRQQTAAVDSVGSDIGDEPITTSDTSPSRYHHEAEEDGMKDEELELEVFGGGGGGDFDSEIDIEQIEMH